ncbi:MAG: hypothetical protein KBS59_06485, partial [Clostridiales bacterium]|nr:hypothetical protein [Clostridiales bacterium]
YYYEVYCLGQWGVTGKTVFNRERVSEQILKNIKPVSVGEFRYSYDGIRISEIGWQDDEDGSVRIYEKPKPGRPYVVGGDTAGEGSDWFVGSVVDNVTGRQVAVLRQRFDEDSYARQMYCLGKYYNDALIGIETNYSTYPQKELERIGYKRFYTRQQEDSYTHKPMQAFGFKTTKLTRPIIIAELVSIVRDHAELVTDRVTLEEMLTFVRNEHGRAEAENGSHDDCVMALAIAYYIRPQQKAQDEEAVLTRRGWTSDMMEDYRRAGTEEKKYLIRKWGQNEQEG